MVSCGALLEFGSAAYLRQAFERASKERAPVVGAFDLTYRCNFRCVHCYCGHLVSCACSQAEELSTKQAADLLRQAADAGCLFMVLSGGEPLLRGDFLHLYEVAKRLGLLVTVFTNGSLISTRHADVFVDLPPQSVEVSVYGATEATYERVTGVRGSYQRARQGIETLLERGVPVAMKTMVLRDSVHEVLQIEAWAKELGVSFRMDPVVTPRLDGDPGPLAQRVNPEIAVAVEMDSAERRDKVAAFVENQLARGASETLASDRIFRCGAGRASFHLDPQGKIRPCLMGRSIVNNTSEMGFTEAWRATAKAVDEATWEGVGGCAECPDIFLCGYCPGMFELEQASPARPPEYVCRLGECRYGHVKADRREVAGVNGN